MNLLTPTAAEATLIRLPISHYCRKVEWAMAYVGEPYDHSDVWFKTLVKFDDINPEQTVPVLVANGHRIAGSGRIMQWLHERHPQRGLYGAQEVEEWEAWADEHLGPYARRMAYRTIHARPTHYTGNPALWALFRAGRGLVLNILKHSKARRYEDADARDGPLFLDRISEQLGDNGTGVLFGAEPTAADFATAALLEPLLRIRKEPIAEHRAWNELQAYVARMRPTQNTRSKARKWSPERRAAWAALPLAS